MKVDNSKECLCCCNQKTEFQNYGCQHKICTDCHIAMNNRKTCLYCDPLQENNIIINISPRIDPIQNIVTDIDNIKPCRYYLFDIIYFVFSYSICSILGFMVFNVYFYFDSNLDKKEITNFNKFSFDKSFFGIIYILIFIYLITAISIICVAFDTENRIKFCNIFFNINRNIKNGYYRIRDKLCCIT